MLAEVSLTSASEGTSQLFALAELELRDWQLVLPPAAPPAS